MLHTNPCCCCYYYYCCCCCCCCYYNYYYYDYDVWCSMKGLVQSLDPMMKQYLPNNTVWTAVKDSMQLASYISNLFSASAPSNHQLLQSLPSIMQNVKGMFSGVTPEVKEVINVLSGVNWHQVITTINTQDGQHQR